MTVPTELTKLAYRIDEAVKVTGLGRTFLYERMALGELKSIKIGGRRLILHTDLVVFLNGFGSPKIDQLNEVANSLN